MARPQRTVLKLGGSVITDKDAAEPALRPRELARLAAEIAALPEASRPAVVVHGAGSFGHPIVAQRRFLERVPEPGALRDWAETQILQNELSVAVARALLEAGLPALPLQASALAVLRDGGLETFWAETLVGFVEQGLVPVLGGVPALDRAAGCAILSGDAIVAEAARAVGARLVVLGTDVPGVLEVEPSGRLGSRVVERIHRGNWDQVRRALSGSGSVDVTGGMAGKVASLLALARSGIQSRIVDARTPGLVTRALAGEDVGTLVSW